jgi:DNA modification methylase
VGDTKIEWTDKTWSPLRARVKDDAGEIAATPMDTLRRAWLKYSRGKVYDFAEHVRLAREMETRGILPSEFMALEVANPGAEYVWDDITRMRTLNADQARKGFEQHVCPLQIDIVERLIERYSNPGDLVCDPFGGIGTVAQRAILLGRKALSIELNSDYHRDGVRYALAAEQKVTMPTLFDMIDAQAGVAA